MLELSKIDELRPLARLVSKVSAAAGATAFAIAGAQARDLHLKHANGIDTARKTGDVDFAFNVGSWQEFHDLRRSLLASGEFTEFTRDLRRLKFRGTLEIDIVPFGGTENAKREIEWPPDQDFVMSAFGFREAFGSLIEVRLPEEQTVMVVSLPALALLKLEAWRDRHRRAPGKDAYDPRLIFENYMDVIGQERVYDEFAQLLTEDFDYVLAGVHILGHDIRQLLDQQGSERVNRLLDEQSREAGQLSLVTEMKLELRDGVKLMTALSDGFRAGVSSAS